MNLLIVESPLQLLCAFEAIKKNNQTPYTLLIRLTGRGQNDEHLLNCVKFLKIPYRTFTLSTQFPKIDFARNLFLWISLRRTKYETVYFGSFYSSALKLIKKNLNFKHAFYLDDGAATIRAQDDIKKNPMLTVNWFTFFHLEPIKNQIIENHEFSHLKQNLYKKTDLQHTYFIGQPPEHMIGMNEEQYLKKINLIAQQYNSENPLIYIPHRVEPKTLLDKITSNDCIKILQLNIPIEMYFLQEGIPQPERIYSFYSTALMTLKSFLPNSDIIAIQYSDVHLQTWYSYFKAHDVSIMNLQ